MHAKYEFIVRIEGEHYGVDPDIQYGYSSFCYTFYFAIISWTHSSGICHHCIGLFSLMDLTSKAQTQADCICCVTPYITLDVHMFWNHASMYPKLFLGPMEGSRTMNIKYGIVCFFSLYGATIEGSISGSTHPHKTDVLRTFMNEKYHFIGHTALFFVTVMTIQTLISQSHRFHIGMTLCNLT